MQGPNCLDCGALLVGRFCSVCGQKRIEPEERRFSWFFKELAGASKFGLKRIFLQFQVVELAGKASCGAVELLGPQRDLRSNLGKLFNVTAFCNEVLQDNAALFRAMGLPEPADCATTSCH